MFSARYCKSIRPRQERRAQSFIVARLLSLKFRLRASVRLIGCLSLLYLRLSSSASETLLRVESTQPHRYFHWQFRFPS